MEVDVRGVLFGGVLLLLPWESSLERWRILLVRTARRAVTVDAENASGARKLAERKMNRDEFAPNEIDVVDAYLERWWSIDSKIDGAI